MFSLSFVDPSITFNNPSEIPTLSNIVKNYKRARAHTHTIVAVLLWRRCWQGAYCALFVLARENNNPFKSLSPPLRDEKSVLSPSDLGLYQWIDILSRSMLPDGVAMALPSVLNAQISQTNFRGDLAAEYNGSNVTDAVNWPIANFNISYMCRWKMFITNKSIETIHTHTLYCVIPFLVTNLFFDLNFQKKKKNIIKKHYARVCTRFVRHHKVYYNLYFFYYRFTVIGCWGIGLSTENHCTGHG